MALMRNLGVWFTHRVYVCLLLICSVTLMISTYSRYQTVQSPQFLVEARKCILTKTTRMNVRKLWDSMHTIVNVCSSKNYLALQHYHNEELAVDHIKTFTENFDCTIASYGLSQSFSVEQILSSEEPACLLFAVDSDKNKGSHFKKIGEFYLAENLNKEKSVGSAAQQRRTRRESKDTETVQAGQNSEKSEVLKKKRDEEKTSQKKNIEKGKNNRKGKAKPDKDVINTELEEVRQNPSDTRGSSDSDKSDANKEAGGEKGLKEAGLLKELNNGSLHNVVEKIDLDNGAGQKGNDYQFQNRRVSANITKSILSMDLETFLLEKVKRNLIYQLSINVANGFDALEIISSSKMRELDICQVNIVLPKPTPKQVDMFASFFDDIMSNQYLTPMIVDFVGEEYTRFYFINPSSSNCVDMFTFSTGQRG